MGNGLIALTALRSMRCVNQPQLLGWAYRNCAAWLTLAGYRLRHDQRNGDWLPSRKEKPVATNRENQGG